LVYCMRWLLWCFCLLAESYETINHYHYHYHPSQEASSAQKKPNDQKKFLTPANLKRGQISGIWPKKANLATLIRI